jgi:hypothetical protein
MAFSDTPTDWLPSWSENGTDITLPIASLPELTAAEADATTGDIRKIWYAFNEAIYTEYNSLAAGDRPGKMLMTKSQSTNTVTGVITTQYVTTLYLSAAVGGLEVVAEA